MPDHKITQVMMDDNTIDASKEIKMVLSIANTLRGPYRAENYKDVIIPRLLWLPTKRIQRHRRSFSAKNPDTSFTTHVNLTLQIS